MDFAIAMDEGQVLALFIRILVFHGDHSNKIRRFDEVSLCLFRGVSF